ncbi:MAG: EsaB/YukD family protein [Lachnospiraceae bacterium]|nr:EsaB/YukD family protein [Lachnospiraceae bacterium]
MVDKVIVSLVCEEQVFDMEIPADVKVERLLPVIAEAVKMKGIQLEETSRLIGNGRMLEDADTLLEAGIWDGSYLKVV